MFNGSRFTGFAKALMIACALLGSAAQQALAETPSVTTVTYGGSSWVGHFPVWVGIEKGFFKTRGLDVKWEPFGTSSSRMSAMVSGSLDFAGTGVIPALSLMSAGSRSFSILATPDSFATVQGVIAKPETKSLAELKGKKIGVTFASSGHLLILDLLKQNGLDTNKDVMLLNMPVAEMPAALKSGQIDAAVAWTPAFNVLLAQPGNHLLADDTSFSLYRQFKVGTGPDVLIVSRSYAKDHPEQTKAFVDAYLESVSYLKTHPQEAADILVSLTKLDKEQQLKAVTEVEWHDLAAQQGFMITSQAFQDGLGQLAQFMVDNKQLGKAPQVSEWFNTDFVKP